jgi:TetR/AcrR family transcriptional regulator, fatty acid biosynthesis regulator
MIHNTKQMYTYLCAYKNGQLFCQMYINQTVMMQTIPATTCPAVTRLASPPTAHSGPGRKASISRNDLLAAALRLVGPNRSISTLSLREVAREAGIAPTSFYRQFRDMDELAVALIDLAGYKLQEIVGLARSRATDQRAIIRIGVQAFIEHIRADDNLMHVMLREGTTGSDAFNRAIDHQLTLFEEILRAELVRLAKVDKVGFYEPALAARAITRLVFAMGATAMNSPPERDGELIQDISRMVGMIVYGAREMAVQFGSQRIDNDLPDR